MNVFFYFFIKNEVFQGFLSGKFATLQKNLLILPTVITFHNKPTHSLFRQKNLLFFLRYSFTQSTRLMTYLVPKDNFSKSRVIRLEVLK